MENTEQQMDEILFTYTTPKPVVKYIETNYLIQNPPFKIKGKNCK